MGGKFNPDCEYGLCYWHAGVIGGRDDVKVILEGEAAKVVPMEYMHLVDYGIRREFLIPGDPQYIYWRYSRYIDGR
jgi:hypothetical protein